MRRTIDNSLRFQAAFVSIVMGTVGGALAGDGVVICVSEPAAEVGASVLVRGGNAVDTAVATALALAVTHPAAGNIGGGGYMLIHQPDGTVKVIDFRETAPTAATREMFVDPKDRTPHRRIGVPGTVAGLSLAHRRFGSLDWKSLVEPAEKLAAEGYVLDEGHARLLNAVLTSNDIAAEFARALSKPDGKEWVAGDRHTQPDLARTLNRIRENGPSGFYRGETARLLVEEMKRGGGLITLEDLAQYEAIEREPIHGFYRGFDVFGVPPSSSGGTTLVLTLNMLECYDLAKHERWSPAVSHLLVESARRAYADRARWLGDPRFTEIPATPLEKAYAKKLAATIDPARATPSEEVACDISLAPEGEHTTHLSALDGKGGAVSLTYTLERPFGGRVVVPGAGFILNDEMNDFNPQPGVTTREGQIGTLPNVVAPGKRMLSSMCPTILAREGKVMLVTGSPGGRTIINTVLQIVVNVVDFKMPVEEAVVSPRLHHQWFPDRIRVEPSMSREHAELILALEKMGHCVEQPEISQGDAHSILVEESTGRVTGAADSRVSGSARYARGQE